MPKIKQYFIKLNETLNSNQIILILLIATLIRLIISIIYSPASDACTHFEYIRFFGENLRLPNTGEVLHKDFIFFQPPFIYVFLGSIFAFLKIFSYNLGIFFIKISPVFFGVIQIYFSYLIIKELFNEKIARYSAIFLTILPIHIFYSSTTFLDIPLTCLITMSIFFLINKQEGISALFAAFALLTKNSTIFFIIWAILFIIIRISNINNENNKVKLIAKTTLKFLGIILIIGSIWLIRNYFAFGNPFFPFLGDIFHTTIETPKNEIFTSTFEPLFSIKTYIEFTLDFFGIPNGRISIISAFINEKTEILFSLWLIICTLFSIPFFIGIYHSIKKQIRTFKQIQKDNIIKYITNINSEIIFLILILLFLIMEINYVTYWHETFTRLILPSIISYALFWAIGLNLILENNKITPKIKKILALFLIGCTIMFITGEITKVTYASIQWEKYSPVFKWIKNNTDKNASIYEEGDLCFQHYTGRIPIKYENKISQAEYLFDSSGVSTIPGKINNPKLKYILNNYSIIYQENITKTIIYKKH